MERLFKEKIILNSKQKEKYKIDFMKQNVYNGNILLILIMIFEISLICLTLCGAMTKMPDPGIKYIICYLFLFVSSLVAFIVVNIYKKDYKKNGKKLLIISIIYSIVIILWSVMITLLDNYGVEHGSDITVNVTILFVLAVALYIPFISYVFIVIINYLIFLIADLVSQNFSFGIQINLIVLSIMCVILVYINHYNKKKSIINNDIIEKQNEELQLLNSELTKMSITDGLTGLYNRIYLDTKLKEEWNKALEHQIPFTIAIVDIDDFKTVNDKFGHMIGDLSIVSISNCILQVAMDNNGYAFRYGGEEFLLILPNKTVDLAYEIVEKMRKNISSLTIKNRKDLKLYVSIGLYSVIPNDNISEYNVINLADKALYKAKNNGKNQICEYKD